MRNNFLLTAALVTSTAACFALINWSNSLMTEVVGEAWLYPQNSIETVPDGTPVPSFQVNPSDSIYAFDYRFNDIQKKPVGFGWEYSADTIERINNNFGVPLDFFEPFYQTEEVLAQRASTMAAGLFHEADGYILPDLNAIVRETQGLTKPIYDMMLEYLGEEASFDSKIELAMKFCQDIRYRIPPMKYNERIISGIFPPSLALKLGYGDCDTKAMIFSSIIAHDPAYDIIAVTVPGHLYLGIKGIPKPYQQFIEYQGYKYIICEPVGPGRLPLGKKTPHALNPIRRIDQVITAGEFASGE